MAVEDLRFSMKDGKSTLIPLASKYVDAIVLAAGVNKTVTVPAGATHVIMTGDADFYVNLNGTTAAVPSADVTDGTASMLVGAGIPKARNIGGIASFGVISSGTAVVTFEWFK